MIKFTGIFGARDYAIKADGIITVYDTYGDKSDYTPEALRAELAADGVEISQELNEFIG